MKNRLREAARQNGIRKFISKYTVKQELLLDKDLQDKIEAFKKKIEGTFVVTRYIVVVLSIILSVFLKINYFRVVKKLL